MPAKPCKTTRGVHGIPVAGVWAGIPWPWPGSMSTGYRLIRTENVKGRAAIAHLPFLVKKIASGWCTAFKVDGNGRFLLSGGMVVKR